MFIAKDSNRNARGRKMMQPIRSIKNQYLGINAHLHSDWQNRGGWNSFHGNHIADLLRLLRVKLLPMGYTAEIEPSLQIRRLDAPDSEPESDITIFDPHPVRPFLETAQFSPPSGVLVLSAPDALREPPLSEKELQGIAVYRIETRGRERGQPVAWLELLSPSNKGGSEDAELYREKRSKILHSGVVFVEIDYLHESGATLGRVANYRIRRNQPALSTAHPYRIAVIDPRPNFAQGQAYINEFDVDTVVPTVMIPLNGEDVLHFDFNVPYQKTFEETLYGLELVDYSQLPLRFERYSPADQARVVNRMLTVMNAVRQGKDLESGPFPVEALPLEEALAQVEALKASRK
ncbi:MAG: DUF4058 family protein [Caldilineaceae bacterium]